MTLKEQRIIALRSARSQLRDLRIDPSTASPDDALAALDDLLRTSKKLCCSVWYGEASENQMALFRKEWEEQKNGQI